MNTRDATGLGAIAIIAAICYLADAPTWAYPILGLLAAVQIAIAIRADRINRTRR